MLAKNCQWHKIVLIGLQAMFNMSSSFLDNTLQSAAPLIDGTNRTINEAQFLSLDSMENGQYYFYKVV